MKSLLTNSLPINKNNNFGFPYVFPFFLYGNPLRNIFAIMLGTEREKPTPTATTRSCLGSPPCRSFCQHEKHRGHGLNHRIGGTYSGLGNLTGVNF